MALSDDERRALRTPVAPGRRRRGRRRSPTPSSEGEELREILVDAQGDVVAFTDQRALFVADGAADVVAVGYDEIEVRRRDAGLAIDALIEGGRLVLDVARGTFVRLAVVGTGAPPGRATWLPGPPPARCRRRAAGHRRLAAAATPHPLPPGRRPPCAAPPVPRRAGRPAGRRARRHSGPPRVAAPSTGSPARLRRSAPPTPAPPIARRAAARAAARRAGTPIRPAGTGGGGGTGMAWTDHVADGGPAFVDPAATPVARRRPP